MIPSIRADKSTPNANMARTLMLGVVAALLILVGADPAARFYDRNIKPRPWLYADVEIVPVVGSRPRVRYAVHAKSYVAGDWRAWVEVEPAVRICGGSGSGTYSERTGKPRLWGWQAWLGRDCSEPAIPYRLCVSYDVRTPSGVPGDFGPDCSAFHDPQEMRG